MKNYDKLLANHFDDLADVLEAREDIQSHLKDVTECNENTNHVILRHIHAYANRYGVDIQQAGSISLESYSSYTPSDLSIATENIIVTIIEKIAEAIKWIITKIVDGIKALFGIGGGSSNSSSSSGSSSSSSSSGTSYTATTTRIEKKAKKIEKKAEERKKLEMTRESAMKAYKYYLGDRPFNEHEFNKFFDELKGDRMVFVIGTGTINRSTFELIYRMMDEQSKNNPAPAFDIRGVERETKDIVEALKMKSEKRYNDFTKDLANNPSALLGRILDNVSEVLLRANRDIETHEKELSELMSNFEFNLRMLAKETQSEKDILFRDRLIENTKDNIERVVGNQDYSRYHEVKFGGQTVLFPKMLAPNKESASELLTKMFYIGTGVTGEPTSLSHDHAGAEDFRFGMGYNDAYILGRNSLFGVEFRYGIKLSYTANGYKIPVPFNDTFDQLKMYHITDDLSEQSKSELYDGYNGSLPKAMPVDEFRRKIMNVADTAKRCQMRSDEVGNNIQERIKKHGDVIQAEFEKYIENHQYRRDIRNYSAEAARERLNMVQKAITDALQVVKNYSHRGYFYGNAQLSARASEMVIDRVEKLYDAAIDGK